MKTVIISAAFSLLLGVVCALACWFIGWDHPAAWGAANRFAAVVLVGMGFAVGAMLGVLVAEKIK